MLLVRKIHVVKINSSKWLAGIAHPSCLWQQSTLLGAWAAQCLTVRSPAAICISPGSGVQEGLPSAHTEHSPAPLTHCTSVSTQHPCTPGAALQAEPASRAQHPCSAWAQPDLRIRENTRKASHCTSLLYRLFSLRLGKLCLILVANESHRVMP